MQKKEARRERTGKLTPTPPPTQTHVQFITKKNRLAVYHNLFKGTYIGLEEDKEKRRATCACLLLHCLPPLVLPFFLPSTTTTSHAPFHFYHYNNRGRARGQEGLLLRVDLQVPRRRQGPVFAQPRGGQPAQVPQVVGLRQGDLQLVRATGENEKRGREERDGEGVGWQRRGLEKLGGE